MEGDRSSNTCEPELSPAFKNNNIPIVLASSNYYIPYTGVFIQSILNHSSLTNNYDIIIFSKDITDRNKELLAKMTLMFTNVIIRYVNPMNSITHHQFYLLEHFTIESYFRSFMPFILGQYTKILYFDCDMIVKCDISELFKTDVSVFFLAATADPIFQGLKRQGEPYWETYDTHILGLQQDTLYFNAGVLIWNIKLFRDTFSLEDLLDLTNRGYRFCDQDILNILCKTKVYFLDDSWNLNTYNNLSDDHNTELISLIPPDIKTKYFDARRRPKIIHFSGKDKPWNKPFGDMSEEFWQVARDSIFYEEIITRALLERKKEV